MKWKRILKLYGVTFVVITLSLLIAPAIVQGIEGSKVFPASKAEHVFNVTMVSQSWQRTDENSINFVLDTRTIKRTYEIEMLFEAKIHEDIDIPNARCTDVTIDIYSNGIYAKQIRHIFYCSGYSGGGAFGPTVIPSETLKVGDNTVQIQINIKSNTSVEIPGTGTFHFVVKDIKLSPVDNDGDGLYNYLDPVSNFNNAQLTAVLMIMLFPPITATGIERNNSQIIPFFTMNYPRAEQF